MTFVWVEMNTTAGCEDSMKNRETVYNGTTRCVWRHSCEADDSTCPPPAMSAFIEDVNSRAPATLGPSFVTNYWYFVWMVTQRWMMTNAFTSAGLSIMLAFVILLLPTGTKQHLHAHHVRCFDTTTVRMCAWQTTFGSLCWQPFPLWGLL